MSWRAAISRNMQEIRIVFNPSTPEAKGIQNFWINNYSNLKLLNPRMPFLFREANMSPTMVIRFDYGKTNEIDCANKTEEEIENILKQSVEDGKNYPRSAESNFNDIDIIDYDDSTYLRRRYA
eukprot:TRINITY_DN321_c1_g1_i1.p1 TRINITY_DN321_c1_g1~~TRINITY_DN321_c1_g1_i1.p1  ORF type:complete len:139 (-),score=19.56 TRINITY_DN321_c1_g1_i1:51-419(-)